MGSSSKSQTVGFRYAFDIHFGIAKAIDGILAIRASGKTAWTGNATTNQSIAINAPNLFGGDKGEGGIQGTLDLMLGAEDQPQNARLAAALGGLVPNFRGFAGGFFSGLVTSINPYPKKWELLRYRQMAGWDGPVWYPQTCAINLADGQVRAQNPAHILYEVYTNRENGLGIDRSMLDDAAFRASALKLYNEGFGLCIGWKRSSGTLADFRDRVCEHIGAYCGPDRNTGLITLKLFRDDYNIEELPLFDEDTGLLSIDGEETSSALIAPSQLFVEYTDPITGEIRRARAVNQAVAQRQGGPSAETMNYAWLPTAELAARVAHRDMRVKASNLRKYKVRLDRRASSIGPGDAFRIRSLRRGIEELVVRAGKIEDGTLAGGTITITALQDVFGMPATSFVAVPPSGYVPPDRTPIAPSLRRLLEVPYRELAGLFDQANLALVDVTAAWISTLAARPTGLSLSYTIMTRPGGSGSFIERGTGDWCPTAQLISALPVGSGPSSVALTNIVDLDLVTVGQAALIDDEIVRVDAIDLVAGTVNLGRGCADTVSAQHVAGARIWFYDGFEGADETEYSTAVSMQVRLLTNTSQGQLIEGLASTDSLGLIGRQGRPYPPGQFKLGGASYPAALNGAVTLSWAHRDRLVQADQLIDATLGSIGPEAGVTYSARFLRADNGAEIQAVSGVSATTTVLSAAYDGEVIVELWAMRAGLASMQRHRHTIAYTGDFTVSLLHFDGSDGSGDFIDSRGKSWTGYNGAVLSTAVKKFGTASGRFANSGHIATAAHMDFNFGSGAFTLGFWVRLRSLTRSFGTVVANGRTSWSAGCRYLMVPSALGGKVTVGGFDALSGSGSYEASGNPLITSSAALPLNDWRHVELCRQGNTLYLFIDGVLQGTATTTAVWDFSQFGTVVGRNLWDGANGLLDADIDELYWRKGEAMHTSNFTPPTVPFL